LDPEGLDLGIAQLDALLGRLPPSSSVLFVNEPGVAADAVLYQAAQHHLEAGRTVVYAVFDRPPSAVRRAMTEYGFHADHERLRFIDGYSAFVGGREPSTQRMRNPLDLREFESMALEEALRSPGAVLIMDPLSNLVDLLAMSVFLRHLPALRDLTRRFALSLALFTQWPYPEDVHQVRASFDAVVLCKGVEEGTLFGQYFLLDGGGNTAKGAAHPLLYKTARPGGVLVYVPKILVTGPHGGGKTTFVHALSSSSRSAEFQGSTVALDHAHVVVDGVSVDLFGTPGQERFDPILSTISEQALGIVLVVDATQPQTFDRAREMLAATRRAGLPVVVAANKQDLAGAWTPEAVARKLHDAEAPVVGCQATDPSRCTQVLRGLLERVLRLEVPT